MPPAAGAKVPVLTAPIIVKVAPLAALRVPPEPVRLLPDKETLPAPMASVPLLLKARLGSKVKVYPLLVPRLKVLPAGMETEPARMIVPLPTAGARLPEPARIVSLRAAERDGVAGGHIEGRGGRRGGGQEQRGVVQGNRRAAQRPACQAARVALSDRHQAAGVHQEAGAARERTARAARASRSRFRSW